VAYIDNGFIAGQIEDSAYQYQSQIESGERIIVGLNEFQVDEDVQVSVMRVDPAVEDEQVTGLSVVKSQRDQERVRQCLAALKTAATAEETNLMEPVLEAVRCYCSLGEICAVLREVFGEYRGRDDSGNNDCSKNFGYKMRTRQLF